MKRLRLSRLKDEDITHLEPPWETVRWKRFGIGIRQLLGPQMVVATFCWKTAEIPRFLKNWKIIKAETLRSAGSPSVSILLSLSNIPWVSQLLFVRSLFTRICAKISTSPQRVVPKSILSEVTTVMMRNLPNKYTQQMLSWNPALMRDFGICLLWCHVALGIEMSKRWHAKYQLAFIFFESHYLKDSIIQLLTWLWGWENWEMPASTCRWGAAARMWKV